MASFFPCTVSLVASGKSDRGRPKLIRGILLLILEVFLNGLNFASLHGPLHDFTLQFQNINHVTQKLNSRAAKMKPRHPKARAATNEKLLQFICLCGRLKQIWTLTFLFDHESRFQDARNYLRLKCKQLKQFFVRRRSNFLLL